MCLHIQLFSVFSLYDITINRYDRRGDIVRYIRESKNKHRLDLLPKKEILEQKIQV
jgi:hypothetical protein